MPKLVCQIVSKKITVRITGKQILAAIVNIYISINGGGGGGVRDFDR